MGNPVLFGTLAIFALIYFYGIYFVKMAAQRKKGITTNQIGRRKEKGLHRVELFMSAATGLIVPIQLLSIVCNANSMPRIGRIIGFILALVGDTVFLISVLCMRDSWRTGIPESDKTEMVTGGIYSVSRNPAFLGFDLQPFNRHFYRLCYPYAAFADFAGGKVFKGDLWRGLYGLSKPRKPLFGTKK